MYTSNKYTSNHAVHLQPVHLQPCSTLASNQYTSNHAVHLQPVHLQPCSTPPTSTPPTSTPPNMQYTSNHAVCLQLMFVTSTYVHHTHKLAVHVCDPHAYAYTYTSAGTQGGLEVGCMFEKHFLPTPTLVYVRG